MLWSRDGRNFAMAKLNEMLRGELGASSVIDDDGIDILQTRLTIKINQYCAGSLECAQEIQVRSDRAIDDAGYSSVEQELESGFLFGAIFVGVTDQDGVPVGSGFVFDCFDDGGKEKISDIGDDDAECSGLLGAQRAPCSIRRIAIAMDGGEDALASWWSDIFGPAERSGNRCDAEIQLLGEIVESHGERRCDAGLEPGA